MQTESRPLLKQSPAILGLKRLVSLMWILLIAASCADAGAGSNGTTTTALGATSTEAAPDTTATLSTTTTLEEGAAPPELAGSWSVTEDDGLRVTLNLRGTSYTIVTGSDQGNGGITVEGETITFHSGSRCDGVDTYTWTTERDMLTLVPSSEIQCPGRHNALDQPLTSLMP